MKITEAFGPMKVPVYNWAENVEPQAFTQIWNLSQFPYAFHHIAIMPDCHSGYGMPIGGVIATDSVVIPNAVGVDIGCGMYSVRSSNFFQDAIDQLTLKDALRRVLGELRVTIPMGFNHHKEKQDEAFMPYLGPKDCNPIVAREYQSAQFQIGTLGGGNHFIEIQFDMQGFLWFTIHSGSRNLGHKVATHYNEVAKSKKDSFFHEIPKDWDLAYLPVDSTEGFQYLSEMNYCLSFAYRNRELMGIQVKKALKSVFPAIEFDLHLNIHHNYVAEENHFGRSVWVHRKGATKANRATHGIIPGSQGSSTYVVEGLGNEDSFSSCSHGAGRVMSRTAARKTLSLADELRKVEQAGVLVHGLRSEKDLDEAPGSYKDINDVMEKQKDLVKIVQTLKPIACIKG